MTLKARLARLESDQAGGSRVIVVDGPAGVDAHAELRARGVIAVERDLVVIITDPVATFDTVKVTIDGQAIKRT